MEIAELKAAMIRRFHVLDRQVVELKQEIENTRRLLEAEGEKTRRHFDSALEQVTGECPETDDEPSSTRSDERLPACLSSTPPAR